MKRLGLVLLMGGCSFQSTRAPMDAVDASGGAGSDAAADAAIDGAIILPDVPVPDAQLCFGRGLVRVCLRTLPPGPITLPGVLDTSVNGNCTQVEPQTGGPELCVMAGTTVTVGSLVAIGARPLVVIGTDTVLVSGTLDVSSALTTNGPRRGAGGSATLCAPSGNGRNDAGGAGGGAGGSFGTVGGGGGTGDGNTSGLPLGPAPGGDPGAAQPAPTVLRGGCRGGDGGEGADVDPQNTGGPGGDGGGAVYLIAATRITINGSVFASGSGGRTTLGNAGVQEGGGGGGSGGMIGLDAPMIDVSGRVVANGGAGGGGGADEGGAPGGNGSTALWNQRAPAGGGDRQQPGEDAGNGAEGTALGGTTNLDGQGANVGAGGGAGGLGLVWTYGTLVGGTMISPAPTPK